MAITNYYVRPVNGNDIAGQGLTHATAYRTLQFAFDDVGVTHGRNAVDGDQFNLCDEGPNVNAASLSLAAYGAPAFAVPLILRGYTLVANDGGVGEIDCNGTTMWAATTYDFIKMIDLEIHSPGDNIAINLDNGCMLRGCYVHPGVSAPINRNCIKLDAFAVVIHCRIPEFGTGSGFSINVGTYSYIAHNYVLPHFVGISPSTISAVVNNVVYCTGKTSGVELRAYSRAIGNVIYAVGGNTGSGIDIAVGGYAAHAFNNIIANFSGVGGSGIDMNALTAQIFGYNAFYNNTTDYANVGNVWDDLRANDIALAADPFVNAAAGNFMLTPAAQVLLRSAGWPSTYLGAAATDAQLTIGAVQYGEGGGGAVSISPWRGGMIG